jgi:RNA-directed DNA polymerase
LAARKSLGPHREGDEPKPVMHGVEGSDSAIVAMKRANEAGRPAEESGEPRAGAKENAVEDGAPRTPSRQGASHGLDRVRQAARLKKEERFTALLHHVDGDQLQEAYFALKREAAPGVDGVTWEDYGRDLEARLEDLHCRVHRGAYRAQPSRRRYIPKPDGRQRPLGIAALEDKIVQRALAEVLNAIYHDVVMPPCRLSVANANPPGCCHTCRRRDKWPRPVAFRFAASFVSDGRRSPR